MTTDSNPPLEVRILQRITGDGSIVSARIARWLEKEIGMTDDRRALLRSTDLEAYEVLTALHLAALSSGCGTNHAAPQRDSADSQIWMSTSEAAETLGVTDRCIRNWCTSGRLHAVMAGGRWLINPHTLALRDIA